MPSTRSRCLRGAGCRGSPRPRLPSPTSASWRRTSTTATTEGWSARTAGWSCSTGFSTRSTTGGAASSAPTTTRPTGRRSSSTSPSPRRRARSDPEWVAYAAHNYTGDNLRRRWDDPEVEKVGEHPVIFVGAGSHASYFAPGEYLTELNIPLPSPLARTASAVRGFWKEKLGQYMGGDERGRRLPPHPIRRLRQGGWDVHRGGWREGVGPATPDARPAPEVGLGLQGDVGALRPRPLRRRGRPRGSHVQPGQERQPGVVRPCGVGRAGQGASPGRGARSSARPARRPGGAVRGATDRDRREEPLAEGVGRGDLGPARQVPPGRALRGGDEAHRGALQGGRPAAGAASPPTRPSRRRSRSTPIG